MDYRCSRCDEVVEIPDGSEPRELSTGGATGPTAHVVRIARRNVHRCPIDPADAKLTEIGLGSPTAGSSTGAVP